MCSFFLLWVTCVYLEIEALSVSVCGGKKSKYLCIYRRNVGNKLEAEKYVRCSLSGTDRAQRWVDCPYYSLTKGGISKYWMYFGDPVCITEKQLFWNSLISFSLHAQTMVSFLHVYVISRAWIRLILFYGPVFLFWLKQNNSLWFSESTAGLGCRTTRWS